MTVKMQGKQAHGSVYPLSSLFDVNAPEAAKLRGRYGSRALRFEPNDVDFLSYRYPSDAANFCACLLKPLERSYGYARARFSQTFIKNSLAQNPWKQ